MARHGGGQGPRRPVKGFRPGKEPPQLRKRQAKEQFGEVNAAQERLIELFSERTPEESRKLMRRWRIGLLIGAGLLAVLGAVLYGWSVIAGVIAHIVAGALLFFWWQLHRQRGQFEAIADAIGDGGKGQRKRR